MSEATRSKTRVLRSILCAVDFSPASAAALRVAVQLALRTGGRVTALYVEDPLLGQGAAAVGYDVARLRKATLAELERLIQRVASPVGLRRDVWSVETILGRPAMEILRFARTMRADLIVMGTHGRRGAGKLLFGSASEGVLRRASVPVLVVPRGRWQRAGEALRTRTILGAIELGSTDRGDARRFARLATQLGASLTLLHVVPVTPGPAWFVRQLEAHDRARVAAARARLDAVAKSAKARARVTLGRPDEASPAVALEVGAGLIVLALRRGRGLFGARQGTTTYHVLCGTKIPVLALPPSAARVVRGR